jgi:F-box-like
MPHANLGDMPGELLIQICRYLDGRPDWLSLALVNKGFRSLSMPVLFHTVEVAIHSHQQLANWVQNTPSAAWANLRHLVIKGMFPQPGSSYADIKARTFCSHFRDSFHNPACETQNREQYVTGPVEADPSLWACLVEMIRRLAALADLTFNCWNKFPPSIVDALHQYHPECRLHINTFSLPGLYGWDAPRLSPQDLALVTSSCLHSISAKYCGMDSSPQPEYHSDAVKDMARGLTPGLKNVRISYYHPGASLGSTRPKPAWPGFGVSERQNSDALHVLDSLAVEDLWDIRSWCTAIDLSRLQVLELSSNGAEDLCFAVKVKFTGLKTLILELQGRGFTAPLPDYDDALSQFLYSLPPLKALKLFGDISQGAFDAVVEQHGGSLQRLHLVASPTFNRWDSSSRYFVFNEEHIELISTTCTQLEELTIKIPRSQGDSSEVAIYRALGSISGLRDLYLILDCSKPFLGSEEPDYDLDDPEFEARLSSQPHFTATDREIIPMPMGVNPTGVRLGHIRDTYINCALDESLAHSIFGTISTGKPSGATLLETLRVTTDGAFTFSAMDSTSHSYMGLSRYMHRSWLVRPSPRDDSRERLVATKLEVGLYSSSLWHCNLNRPDQARAVEIFRSIWPGEGQDGDWDDWEGAWRDNWHSLPLYHG